MSAIEQTECSIAKVYVFNVPPRSSSTGHRAADWPKESLWSGRLRLVSAGDKCAILLEHTDKDGLFARCPVDSKATVEQVTDSSRYFVIKVSDGHGHSAYLGVAFEKREEAFEFKVALQTAQNRSAADKKASDYFSAQPAVETQASDASIEVNLTGKFAKKKDAAADGAAGAAGAGAVHAEAKKSGGFAIAPPKPTEKKSRRAIAQSHGTTAAAGGAAAGGGAAPATAAAAGAATPAPVPAKAAKSSAAPAAGKPSTALDQDATLLEAFGAAPPATAAPAAVADPLAFFSSGK